jgi:4-hydroxy-2-oxovalerate aldolase
MSRTPVILDCTIRDGSYAIDFKFTAADTALIAGLLDEAGLPYIEIGHGLGLGAAEAGKDRGLPRDIDVIRRTRERVSRGRLGAFFIAGLGSERDLRDAAGAGLDFVRVGQNADEIDEAWPYVDAARELGLEVFVNLMKTYGVTPDFVARTAVRAAEHGAAGIYVVDSAGGMLPDEVAEYVRACIAASDLPIGFHGHNNLHLAVANAIAAWEAGATFIDTSVYGIGRSSGNVPTEVMAAVFDRLGVDCGVDAMAIVDIAASYLLPLAENLHPHTMTAVSLGYGRFHSAYLPRAQRAAEEAGIDPHRLIVELGRRDMMRLSDELLSETVARLEGSRAPQVRTDVARFSDDRFGPRRISNRATAVGDLLDGLEVVAAKRHLEVVLDLVPSHALDEEALTAEFVLEDDAMALGRLRFGSADALLAAVAGHEDRIGLALLDGGGADLLAALAPAAPRGLVPYRSDELVLEYLGDVALVLAARAGSREIALVDPGLYARPLVDALASRLGAVGTVTRGDGGDGLTVVAGPLAGASGHGGPVVSIGHGAERASAADALVLDARDALRGTLPRWQRAVETSRAGERRPAVAS